MSLSQFSNRVFFFSFLGVCIIALDRSYLGEGHSSGKQ